VKCRLCRSVIALAASVIVVGLALSVSTSTAHGETIRELTAQANAEARRLRADARLVQIEVMTFGLVIGPSGLPDISKVGPPTALLFHYISPAARTEVRVLVRAGAPAARPSMRADQLPSVATPYTAAIPDTFMELDAALARAQQGGFQRECAGINPSYGCGRVVRADLHTHIAADGSRTPVWTFDFGQDAAAGTISREIDAITGRVIALGERGSRREGGTPPAAPFSDVTVRVQLSEEHGAPTVTTLRDGQEFVIVVDARLQTRVSGLRMCAGIAVRSSGIAVEPSCRDAHVVVDTPGGLVDYTTKQRFSLGPAQSTEILDITGTATANGVTQEARTSVRVSR
jgi:hypothetical protein